MRSKGRTSDFALSFLGELSCAPLTAWESGRISVVLDPGVAAGIGDSHMAVVVGASRGTKACVFWPSTNGALLPCRHRRGTGLIGRELGGWPVTLRTPLDAAFRWPLGRCEHSFSEG